MTQSWLLYGANGYTGELIAREAVKRGMRPVLAGRSRARRSRQLAAELGCASAVFALDDHTSMVSALDRVRRSCNCAGPFSQTARSMMQGCLATHVHYFDITGEIDVFELAHSVARQGAARSASSCVPASVSMSCRPIAWRVALKAGAARRHASFARLRQRSGLSKGTAKTAIESAGGGSRVRRDGKIISDRSPRAHGASISAPARNLPSAFPGAMSAPRSIRRAFRTSRCSRASSPQAVKRMQRANTLRPLLRQRWVSPRVQVRIERRVRPPDQTQRDSNPSFVWGEVRNAAGLTKTARAAHSQWLFADGILFAWPSREHAERKPLRGVRHSRRC